MDFFRNIKQKHLTPSLRRESQLLKDTDLASSSIVSPASSTVSDKSFKIRRDAPLLELDCRGGGRAGLGQHLMYVSDVGYTECLSQASLHLPWGSCLGCSCLRIGTEMQPGVRRERAGIHGQRSGQNLVLTALEETT